MHKVGYFLSALGDAFRAGAVTFGQCNNTLFDPQQLQNIQVFLALWHRAVVGCDDQQRRLVAGNPSDHVVNEAMMSWHVNKTDAPLVDVGEA